MKKIFVVVAVMVAVVSSMSAAAFAVDTSDALTTRRDAVEIVWHAMQTDPSEAAPAISRPDQACEVFVANGWIAGDEDGSYRLDDAITEPEMFQLVYNVLSSEGFVYSEDWASFDFSGDDNGVLSGTPVWAIQAVDSLYYYSVWSNGVIGDERALEAIGSYDFSTNYVTHARMGEFARAFLMADVAHS